MLLLRFGLRSLALVGGLVLVGCASRGGAPATSATTPLTPAERRDSTPCPGSLACKTDDVLLATPQLRNAVHDLGRLGLATQVREVGIGKVLLTLTGHALEPTTALAFELEHLYRAYRTAYQLGDAVMIELWRDDRRVGQYTSQGLLLRLDP